MSIVDETVGEIRLGNIPARIAIYEQLIEASEGVFKLAGRGLEECCKQHAQDLLFYDLMLQECKTVEETIKGRVEEIESQLYQKYHSGMQIKLSTTDIRQYIKGDPSYVKVCEILLEVQHSKRRLESVVEALKSFGWSINNIVKLRIAQLDHVTL
jgi:hypothetical protein